ncbi:MAG: prepilin-type N-terminal cleavage/methylation domain-containing protein [Planctomycetota bacterium]
MNKHPRPCRAGFTLVELLVVIGIIALLISILLPSLNAARAQAKKVACAASLRELSNAMHIYAAEWDDYVPYGHIDQAAFNYVINFNNTVPTSAVARTSLGLLYEAGLMPSGKAFYCPEEVDPLYVHDNRDVGANGEPINPWIFEDPNLADWLDTPPASGNRHVRIGYGARPDTNWIQAVEIGNARPGIPERPFEDIAATASGNPVRAFPRMSELSGKSILADLFFNPGVVERRHGDGNNVAFSDGSVRYIPLGAFDNEEVVPAATLAVWEGLAPTAFPGVALNYVFLYENNSSNAAFGDSQGLWLAFDKY